MNWPTFRLLHECLPEDERMHLPRLEALSNSGSPPKIVVFGKYNHGKSSLLNALIGSEHFKVSDIRETVAVSSVEHDGLIFLDTPGLDADTVGDDDRLAMHAIRANADIRLFVHNVKEGELDAAEFELLQSLIEERNRMGRPLLLALTQCDQVEDSALAQTLSSVSRQIPGLPTLPVSASRYRQGKAEGKVTLTAQSGFNALGASLEDAVNQIRNSREREKSLLIDQFAKAIRKSAASLRLTLEKSREEQSAAECEFQNELCKLRTRFRSKLGEKRT